MFLSSYRNTVLNQSACVFALGYFLKLLKLVMKVTCTFDRMLMLFVRVETVTLCCSLFHPLTNRLETSRCAMKGIAFHTAVKNEKPNITCGMFSARESKMKLFFQVSIYHRLYLEWKRVSGNIFLLQDINVTKGL